MDAKKQYSLAINERFIKAMAKITAEQNITDRTFGETVGMSSSNLVRLKESNGVNTVTLEAVARLCDTYGVSPDWLFTGKGKFLKETSITNAIDLLKEAMHMIEADGKRIVAKKKKEINR